ncbi:hypothetical protein jpw_08685 [Pseudomonas asiatica]|jgi:uncharacterized membrane-anchored protein YhcB (DUF1043 family)|uniref:hypothetical protein n=1 Tax=Pseudomonas asiatica TaxID=2219225 RepID=UPI0021F6D034|nr:hypothetical protein [Pseudomonas asiatica]UYP84237.1 hypothetical protein jpw_08685 [Pseudomonas asiatica]
MEPEKIALTTALIEAGRWIVPSIVVIIGWYVVSRGNDKRETRKEVRQFLDRTITSVENIRKNALDCLTQSVCDSSKKLELAIDPELLQMESALSLLKLKNNNVVVDGIRLRKAVSDNGQYRVAGRKKLDMDHRILMEINAAAAELIAELEKAYRQTYQDK